MVKKVKFKGYRTLIDSPLGLLCSSYLNSFAFHLGISVHGSHWTCHNTRNRIFRKRC